jgi:hypothetical protein
VTVSLPEISLPAIPAVDPAVDRDQGKRPDIARTAAISAVFD